MLKKALVELDTQVERHQYLWVVVLRKYAPLAKFASIVALNCSGSDGSTLPSRKRGTLAHAESFAAPFLRQHVLYLVSAEFDVCRHTVLLAPPTYPAAHVALGFLLPDPMAQQSSSTRPSIRHGENGGGGGAGGVVNPSQLPGHGMAGSVVPFHVVFVLTHMEPHDRSNIDASGSPTWKLV